jgi:CubicO group peptidase (beta-lactamase class C family)
MFHMFHKAEGARKARFEGNEAGRMIAKVMSQSSAILRTTAHDRFTIQRHVSLGFEAVREAFAENFVHRRELGEPINRSFIAELDRIAVVLARQKPAWEPGTRQAYHAITLGFYESELLRRVDPQHRSLGQFFQDEIATPLRPDVLIRLPESIPNSRLATIARHKPIDMLRGFALRFTLEAMNRSSKIVRALRGSEFPYDEQRIYARDLEVPSGGGVGTARAIAYAYSVFATCGSELGLRRETLDLLAAPATPPARGFYDESMRADGVQFSLGVMKPSPVWPFGSPSSFGSLGAGGSLGFADPTAGVGYAYVTSQIGTRLTGDARDVALRGALYSAIPGSPGAVGKRIA